MAGFLRASVLRFTFYVLRFTFYDVPVTDYTDEHARAGIKAPLPAIETWPNQFPDYEITVEIPESLAARVTVDGGLSSVRINRNDLQKEGAVWTTPGWESAADRVDLRLELGAGSVAIKPVNAAP